MTVTVNLHNDEQEKALIEFLEKMQFEYQSDVYEANLTELQKTEILKRDSDYLTGKTTARDWNEIKRDLQSVYR